MEFKPPIEIVYPKFILGEYSAMFIDVGDGA